MTPKRCVHLELRALLLVTCVLLLSCKISDDATAAAKQMATTSTDLANYYSALSQTVSADIALNDLQHSLLNTPFAETDRAPLIDAASELQKRSALAKSLQELSTAFSSLTGSSASTDVSNASSKLANELSTLKAIPTTSASPVPIPQAIGDAAKLLVTLAQQYEEKKVAPAIDATVSGLAALFKVEQPVYNSLNKTYLALAGSLAKYCVDQNLIADGSVIAPTLQPFGLAPNPNSANNAALNSAAKNQVDQTVNTLTIAHDAASDAMLQGITEMGNRFHQLATGKRMSSRGTPVTLTTVENWINTATSYLSSNGGNTAGATSSSKSTKSNGESKP